MIEIVLSLLSVLLGVGLFILGYMFGRRTGVPGRGVPAEPPVVSPGISEEEEQRIRDAQQQLEEEKKAFSTLRSYNVNDAYGYNLEDLTRERDQA